MRDYTLEQWQKLPEEKRIHISPAEQDYVKKLIPEAVSSSWVEDFGLDFAWITPFGVAGVQRKKFPDDFLASRRDGRLTKEVLQMGDVRWKYLVLEGIPKWATNGELQGVFADGIHINQLNAMLWSIDWFHSIRHHWTNGTAETVRFIRNLYYWTMKESHTGFCAEVEMPKTRDANGNKIKVDWREWVLMHMPGISQTMARKILAYEPEPLRWFNDGRDLQKVPLIGPGRADKLIRALKPDV